MYTSELILKASGAVTANGQSDAQDVSIFDEGLLLVDITTVSGTSPTLDLTIQTEINGKWVALPGVSIAQQTAANALAVALTNFGKKIRLSWTVGGTSPSFTFSLAFIGKG
jgi:uncharacterized integral membrane protein